MVGGQGEEKVFSSSSPSPQVERGPGGEVNSGAAKTSIRHLKLLDPACGSGHFLIIAFDLLFAFYQEEARHRGETWSDRDIVESILTNNLHGLDLDPRAVQIAAAALYLKAKALYPQAELTVLNLVAANLNLAALPEDDPALVELRQAVTASTGIPEALTNQIVQGLKGADAWGSLLKVDDAVDGAIASYEWQQWKQGELFAADSSLTSPLAPLHGMERGTGTSPLAPLHSVERGTGNVEGQGEENLFSSTSPSPLVERGPGGEVPVERGLGGEVLYLSAYSGDRPDSKDSLHHPACQPLHQAWAEHGGAIAPGKTLRDWLRLNFFKDVHVGMYDQRPIYFPLSSEKKNFVALISIHRWADDTLTTLLADHLVSEQTQLDGEIADLLGTKAQGDVKTQTTAEKRYTELMQLKTELDSFIQLLRQLGVAGEGDAVALFLGDHDLPNLESSLAANHHEIAGG